jgi:uncharacterized protein involved in exopolysaccharide biosynthesis
MNLFSMVTTTREVIPEPEPVNEEREEVQSSGYDQLRQILKRMGKERAEDLQAQVASLELRMVDELAVIKRADSYDVVAESSKPDFDRAEAAKLEGDKVVAEKIVDSLKKQKQDAQIQLSGINREMGRLSSVLETYANQLDELRRSVAISVIRGNGQIREDKQQLARYYQSINSAEDWLNTVFEGEDAEGAISLFMEQLTRYEVEPDTRKLLLDNMHPRDAKRFQKEDAQ